MDEQKLYDYGMWLPPHHSPEAMTGKIDLLINFLHIFMILLFIGWGIFMVKCLIDFRARPGHKATYEPIKGKLSKYIEIVIVIVEVVLLVGLSMPAWSSLKLDQPETADLEIRIVAQQFAWNFHYPGPDGIFGKTAPEYVNEASNPLGLLSFADQDDPAGDDDIHMLNTLYIPAGKQVLAHLTSKDVIHSFWIPVLRVKQDAIPGMEVPIWFQAKEDVVTGRYADEHTAFDIACVQLCGITHFNMRGMLFTLTPEDFDAWLEEQSVEVEFGDDDFEDFEDEEE